MWNCGLDGHEESMRLCVVDAAGKRKFEETAVMASTEMEALLGPLVKDGLRVAFEASGVSYTLYDRLKALGCADVLVWPPHKLRVIAESKAKNDKNDARLLAELLRMNFHPRPVYIPTTQEREIRDFLTTRQTIVRSRVRIIQSARSMMVRLGKRVPSQSFHSIVGWKRVCEEPSLSDANRAVLMEMRNTWTSLRETEKRLDETLNMIADADERAVWLRTIPGVGAISALWLLVGLGDVERFNNSREVSSYLGLVPTMEDSANVRRRGHITKQGKADLRWVWVQAANSYTLSKGAQGLSLTRWFQACSKKRGRKIAIVALSRKLMVIAWHLLKEKRGFRPETEVAVVD